MMERPLIGETVNVQEPVASVILAAGRGSRMTGYDGNKTLLPLIPEQSPFVGSRPILIHILENLPSGPKAVVVHHRKQEVIQATQPFGVVHCEQDVLNGTGGALLAARSFLEGLANKAVIITMGDVPLVRRRSYEKLVAALQTHHFVILGFRPKDKRQYGVLRITESRVREIIEWTYWKDFPSRDQDTLDICNSGIYASRVAELLSYLPVLASQPHRVQKERAGKMVVLEEFFITDIVGYMAGGGLSVGHVVAEDEMEVMGVDDLDALRRAQQIHGRIPS